VFMILLITGNTMAMNIRERSHEIAIMKSLGFQNESLIGILVGESVTIALMEDCSAWWAGNICSPRWTCPKSVWDSSVRSRWNRRRSPSALPLRDHRTGERVIPAFHVTRLTVSDGLRRIG